MTATDSTTLLGWLKAVGEDSRLRLLALCARRELSVSDLAEALRQSEPRVSRHLKILCDAGLLERMRQGQWVHYRITKNVAAAAFVEGLLGQVARDDPLFAQVRTAARVGGGTATGLIPTQESRLGRALKGFVEAVDAAIGEATGSGRAGRAGVGGTGVRTGGGSVDGIAVEETQTSALVVGVEHLELLETAAAVAGRCVAIAHSRRAAQSARAFAERRGLPCKVLLAKSANALSEKDVEAATELLARESPAGAGAAFDVVFLDHVALSGRPLEGMLTYGRRALTAGGRLWVFERYEALAHGSSGLAHGASGQEAVREKVVEHPIGRLRRLLGDVELSCERLSPIEADGDHVIAALAVPSRGVSRGTGAAGAA